MKIYVSIVLGFYFVIAGCHTPNDTIERELNALYDVSANNQDSLLYIAKEIDSISRQANYEPGRVKAKILSGYHFWKIHKMDTAEVLLTECLDYFEGNTQFENSLDHGRACLYISKVYLREGELEQAKANAWKAFEIFDGLSELSYKGEALNMVGGVEFSLDKHLSALEYFLKARKLKEADKTRDRKIITELNNIAIIYLRMEQYREALQYTFKALRVADSLNRYNSQMNLLNSIGAIHSSSGRKDSALYYYNRSREVASEQNNTFMVFLSDYNTANTYSALGDIARSDQLVTERLTDPPGGFVDMINSLKAKNYLKLNVLDSAIAIGTRAYKSSAKKNLKGTMMNESKILMEAYNKLGRYDSAMRYATIHYALKDSAFNKDVERKFSDLRVEIETLEKQAQIDVLEKEKKLARVQTQGLIGSIIGIGMILFLIFKNYQTRQKAREAKLKLETITLSEELEKKKSLLSAHTLNMIHRNNGLEEIEKNLDEVQGKAKTDIKRIIKINKAMDKDWENFNTYFSQIHKNFYKQLADIHGNLSPNEKKLAALIKLNLSSREISSLMNIESRSITMAKYRLKKKLQLNEDEDLIDHIQKI